MSTRRACVRRRPLSTVAAGSVCFASLMLGSARAAVAAPVLSGSPVHAACDLGLLGVCVVPSPTATALPIPVPSAAITTPAPILAVPSALAAPATAAASAAAGVIPGAVVSAAPSALPVPTPAGCTVDLLGSCITLPGTATPTPAGAPSGTSVSLPPGGGSLPVLTLGGSGCVASVAGVCAAATGQTGGGAAQGCIATLLTVCVPGSGTPNTCVLNGVACVDVPGGSTPGSGGPSSNPPSASSTQRGTNPSGTPSASSSTSSSAGAAVVSAALPGGGLPDAAVAAPVGTVSAPPVPASGLLAQLGGLHLGSLLLWPVFAGLDLLAALALVVVVRRSWSAAAVD